MVKRIRKNPGRWLLAACYAAGLLVLFCVHLAGFAANRAAYASGALAPAALTVDDFDLVELVEAENGALVSTGGDPQLLLKDKARRVENVTLEAAYSRPPLSETVYWAAPGQDYSVRNMAGPEKGDPARFLLPAAGVQGLRIDPGSVAGNTITLQRVLINQPRAVGEFFVPAAGEVILLATVPGLAACGLWLALGAARLARQNKSPADSSAVAAANLPDGEGGDAP